MSSVAKTLRRAAAQDSPLALKTQLPPRPQQLIGREEQIETILARLNSKPKGHRLLIHGLPGVGKTVMALEVAHSSVNLGRYDVIVWLDCQQSRLSKDDIITSATALRDLPDIVRELALAVNAEAILREPERDRIPLLRSRLSEHHCLIIADAVDDLLDPKTESYLFDLPDTVDIVATSRSNLRWREEECAIPLSSSATESLVRQELSVRRIDQNPHLVKRLVEISDGIPQTIGWLCTLMSRGITLSNLEQELLEPDATISQYYFRKQWEEVAKEPSLIRALVLIAVTPFIRKRDVSAAIKTSPRRNAQLALVQLEEMHLITCQDDHIAMLPTIRNFVLRTAEKSEGLLVSLKTDWISNLASRVNEAQSRETWREVFAEIESFRLELLGALRAALEPDIELRREGAGLLQASVYYLYARGLWDDLLKATEWAVPLQAQLGDIDAVMEVGLTWGIRAYRYRESVQRARQFLDQISSMLSETSVKTSVPLQTYLRLAETALRPKDRENIALAEQLAQDARVFLSSGNHEWACRAMLQAGNVWSESGCLVESRQAFEWVYTIAAKSSATLWTKEMLALSLGNRGIIANRLSQFELATGLLSESVVGLPQAYDQATAHGELARAYLSLGKIRKAKHHAAICICLTKHLNIQKSVMESEIGWDLDVGKRLAERGLWKLWLDRMRGK